MISIRRSSFIIFALITTLLGGCVTPTAPARYYRLNLPPLLPQDTTAERPRVTGRLLIGPVEVADHLDRTQLVTSTGPNRLQFNELDQWAGSLAGQIEQVLLHHLANRLGRNAVLPYPAEADRDTDRRLRVRVLELNAGPGPHARLTLFWQASNGGRPDRHGLESLEQVLDGTDLDHTVAGYDALLAEAANRIAADLRSGRKAR